MPHLWEVDHPYYCSESNFYSNDCHFEYKSFQDYINTMGLYDLDLNLIFRWDWKRNDEETYPPNPDYDSTIDDNYRGYTLSLFFVMQRKGVFAAHEVQVCRADEPAVIEYLRPRLAKLQEMWEPLST